MSPFFQRDQELDENGNPVGPPPMPALGRPPMRRFSPDSPPPQPPEQAPPMPPMAHQIVDKVQSSRIPPMQGSPDWSGMSPNNRPLEQAPPQLMASAPTPMPSPPPSIVPPRPQIQVQEDQADPSQSGPMPPPTPPKPYSVQEDQAGPPTPPQSQRTPIGQDQRQLDAKKWSENIWKKANEKPSLLRTIAGAALSVSPRLRGVGQAIMHPPDKMEEQGKNILAGAKQAEGEQEAQSRADWHQEATAAQKEARLASVAQRLATIKPAPTPLDRYKQAKDIPGITDEDVMEFALNGKVKPLSEKPDHFGTAPPGSTIYNTKTGETGAALPGKDPKELQRDDRAIAIRQKQAQGLPVTPEETAFLTAYKKYVDESKVQPGVQRMEVMGQMREYPVINKQNGQMEMRSAAEINANKGLYAPAGQGASAMSKEAVFKDLHFNIDTARKAMQSLDAMDPKTRMALSIALRHSDPSSALSTFLTGAAGTLMNPQQQEAVQALALLSENALSLRSVAGMGQGAEDLRAAIQATLPSGKSPSKGYALQQLNKFEEVVKRLETGVPQVRTQNPQVQSPAPTQASGNGQREQHSPSTGQYRYTLDGGQTWQPGRLPRQ